jgi:murein DD-endopeptidase MepM/ murein hydrolase activator NlpD
MIDLMKEYRISSPYGKRISPITGKKEFHTGIDLVKPPYSPIKAFIEGTVIHARMGQANTGVGGFGNTVIIKDKYNHVQMYAHLTDYCVKVGDFVKVGQVIGRQGDTGKSAGQHLHFEVRTKPSPSFGFGYHTDPVAYVDWYYQQEEKLRPQQPAKKPVQQASTDNKAITKKEIERIMSKYFKDIPKNMEWVSDPADRLYEKGILKGKGNGILEPDAYATRGELIVLIDRLVEYFAKHK